MADVRRLCSDYGDDYYYEIRKRRKKNKRVRIIHAPSPKLKTLQRDFADWFYQYKKSEFDVNPQITGFLPGKSIADNALPHLKKDWVINMDVKNFFPSTSPHRIEVEFEKLPKSRSFRYWLSRNKPTVFNGMSIKDLCDTMMVKRANQFYELPQGSPASPVLANYIAIDEIDKYVKVAVHNWGTPSVPMYGRVQIKDISFTRYADDITVSFNDGNRQDAESIVNSIKTALSNGIYEIKEQKTVIKHRSQRQLVTGVIVNGDNPRIDRRLMNNMRAAIHNSKNHNGELSAEIKGMMSFIQSINKAQYNKLNNQIGDSE